MMIEVNERGNKLEMNRDNSQSMTQIFEREVCSKPTKKQFINKDTVSRQEISTEPSCESTQKNMLDERESKEKKTHAQQKILGSCDASNRKFKNKQDCKRKLLLIIQKLKRNVNIQTFLSATSNETISEFFSKKNNPIDITTVENKIKEGIYMSPLEFATDIRKIWNDALLLTEENSEIFLKVQELSAYFETLFKEVENETLTMSEYDLQPEYKGPVKEKKTLNPPTNISTSISNLHKSSAEHSKTSIPHSDRVHLGQMIRRLPTEFQQEVFQIVTDGLSDSSNNPESFEFDITTLPTAKIRELKQYIDSKFEVANKFESDSKPDEETQTKIKLHQNTPKMSKLQERSDPSENANTSSVLQKQNLHPAIVDKPTNILDKSNDNLGEDDSSFISDSDDSDSEDEGRKKPSQNDEQQVNKHDIENFQAGEYGSMVGSYILNNKRR